MTQNRYTDEIAQALAEVRTACEYLIYNDGVQDELGQPMGVNLHLYHCAMVYRLRDGMTPEEAAEHAWQKNLLGVKTEDA